MAKRTKLPAPEWLNGLSKLEAFQLLGWLYSAAKTKPAIAEEFADYARWKESRVASANTEH